MNIPLYYHKLKTDGYIHASVLSKRSLAQLRTLFSSGVLIQESSRRGPTIKVCDPQCYTAWLAQQYPATSDELKALAATPRAQAVAAYRDTKRGQTTHHQQILLVRAPHQESIARVNADIWPIGEHTCRHGVAAQLITKDTHLLLPAPCVLVENQELFLHAERLVPEAKSIVFSSGKISNILITVLSHAIESPNVWYHLPDYDPVGLNDFLRLYNRCGRANGSGILPKLYIPDNIDALFERYGNQSILQKPKNKMLFESLSKISFPSPEAAAVFSQIYKRGKVLEQEAILACLLALGCT